MKTLIERFEDKIFYSPDGCWYWVAAHCKGYGTIGVIKDGVKTKLRANRASYELYKGSIPEGLLVCHSCDNTYCVNPNHLFLGTHSDNMQDALSKGRLYIPKNPIGGPIKPHFKYIGEKFNMLTVIDYFERRNGNHYWLCECECGNRTKVTSGALRSGGIKSCGCIKMKNFYSKRSISV